MRRLHILLQLVLRDILNRLTRDQIVSDGGVDCSGVSINHVIVGQLVVGARLPLQPLVMDQLAYSDVDHPFDYSTMLLSLMTSSYHPISSFVRKNGCS